MTKLSVIVCTYNRDKYILETLQHLKDQTCEPGLYEVIVIDNNSTDQTEQICRNFIMQKEIMNFLYFRELNQGNTYSRNRGILESRGQYISFIDDDARATEKYCEHIISFFDRNPGVSVIGGRITPVYEHAEPAWMSRFLWPLVAGLDMGDKVRPFKGSRYPIGANMAYRAEVFARYGNFKENLGKRPDVLEGGDEKDLIFRVRNKGLKIFYVPDVHVFHVIPESRLKINYIRQQAIGVGMSEKRRLQGMPAGEWMKKVMDELIKIGGTFVLAFVYFFTFKFLKGMMLIRFRFWVLNGYQKKVK
ncbi:MAG: glycosyltransferase family 2 protein [Cyclobacteriaceae bacterium]|nr:glycosyltransferase family 2 protein [Cyclobacteriaceae bacterium]